MQIKHYNTLHKNQITLGIEWERSYMINRLYITLQLPMVDVMFKIDWSK